MTDGPDSLFERFRRSGDTQALGRAFDETAPRLLQLAVHFVGDVGAAEDLVQATFVTAIERASTFDASRQLEAWLAGILANHARDLRRAAQRELDTSALVERIEATPLEHALDAEWSSALARALDEVPEPYRVVLILRLQHGMEPIKIAHALQRSPGAVRVQLHRGRELLRKLLPPGIVASALFLAEPGRGLAQVKAKVVAHAAGAKGAVGITSLVKVVLMSTKVAISIAGAVAALAALLLLRHRPHEPSDRAAPVVESGALMREPLPDSPATSSELASNPTTQRVEVSPTAAAISAKRVKLHGLVYDADSNAGIAHADVELFAPQPMKLSEVCRRWHDRLQVMRDGVVHGLGWPRFASDITDEQRLDAEDVLVYSPPLAGTPAIEHAVTNERGEFEIDAPESLGCIVCSAKEYASSVRPLSPAEVNKASADELAVKVAMSAPKSLKGYVVDEDMKRIERVIRLRFIGSWELTSGNGKDTNPQGDQWIVNTKPDGSFECDLPAKFVTAVEVEPDLGVVKQGHVRDGGSGWAHDVWPEPGHVDEPLVIVMKSVASIAVRDRVTREPIEDLHLLCTGDHTGQPLRIGRFLAPRGRMRIASEGIADESNWGRSEDIEPCECTVWADGYLPLTRHLADLTHGPVTEFDLERGEASTITGFVHDAGVAIWSARISLSPIFNGWRESGGYSVAITTSDRNGSFRIPSANGSFRLRITAGAIERSLRIDVPSPAPIDVEMSVDTTIVVDVRDSSGVPKESFTIILRGLDGRWVKSTTDSAGLVTFPRLSPGKYTVEVNHFSQAMEDPKRSPPARADQTIPIELGAGEMRRVDVVIPSEPRFARLVVDGADSLVGWKACGSAGKWVDVELTGRIPLDIRGTISMKVRDPNSHEWSARLPPDAADGHVIRVALDGPGYEGVVTSQDTGLPIGGLRVTAWPWNATEDSTVFSIATCDEKGRFTLRGLADDMYYIRFQDVPFTGRREEIGIRADKKPSSPPTPLAIDLPKKKSVGSDTFGGFGFEGFEEIQLSGVIRRGSSAASLSGSSIASHFPRDGYTLLLWSRFSTNADGSFQVRVPAASTYSASLLDAVTDATTYVEWTASGAADREVHDIELP